MTFTPPILAVTLPDHKQLPESDGSIVQNFQEHPQSILLTESIWSVLERIHPDGQYCIGQDSGIYWRITEPPLNGCKAPDWFYEVERSRVEVYHLVAGRYELMTANERGHYRIAPLQVELGIWQGQFDTPTAKLKL